MTIVWLIRHGESEANAGIRVLENATTNLTTKGREQAHLIPQVFDKQPPSLIVTSPYIRTKQTAEPTIRRFPSTPQVEWLIQEFSFLSRERRRNTTLTERRPMSADYWSKCDPLYVDGDGAESFTDMIERVQDFRYKAGELDEQLVAVFTHETFIRAFLWSTLTNTTKIDSRAMSRFRAFMKSLKVPNCGIIKLEFRDSEIWLNGIVTSHLN
ncbi:MAG: histidine phosphatase family protein [Cyanobacteria bacterium P01_A01_bin.84]